MKKPFLISLMLIVLVILLSTKLPANNNSINWQCNSTTGLSSPAPVCSKEQPCKNLLPTYKYLNPPVYEITSPSQGKPYCGTGQRGKKVGRPIYNDGTSKTVKTKIDNITRYYCEFISQSQDKKIKRPLVIFVHGSGGYGGSMYDSTSLRTKAPSFNLTDDPDKQGFNLIALQSRNLHWPTKDPQDGAKFDSYHRNFATNPDVEYLDKVIDKAVASGSVDPARIYLMGWSNGARFTAFYGLTRHQKPTSAGNRIAAVANFSGGDPYKNIQQNYIPSCEIKKYPVSKLPLYMISRTCDGVACNEKQAAKFKKENKNITPGNVAETWVNTLKNKIKDPNVLWQKINYYSKPAKNCTPAFLCSSLIALRNHFFWPDGYEDKTGIDWEPEMLKFLKKHPLQN